MTSGNTDDQDRADVERLAAGRDAGLTALMDRYGDRLFRFLVRALRNETEAADLAEETFVRVYQNCRRFDPRQKFSTWLYAIAANLVRDRFRWRTRHPEVSANTPDDYSGAGWLDHLPDPSPSPGERAQMAERVEFVRRAVEALPQELKTCFILAEYEGLSHAEIAEIEGGTAKAVEMRIYRARRLLREQLAGLFKEA